MGDRTDVQRVQIVSGEHRDGWTRGTVILLVLSIVLIVVALNMEFGDHTPRYRSEPEPLVEVAAGAWFLANIAAPAGVAVVAFLVLRRFYRRRERRARGR